MSIITDQPPASEDPQSEPDMEALLTTGQAATRMKVVPQTVARWATEGRLPCTRTLGGARGPGHRRFRAADLDEAMKPAPAAGGAW
jgi:excisionase family DNA binding protein